MNDANALSSPNSLRKNWLRNTLRLSQQEAVASATMTATSDNFFNAFAVYLHASAIQMGWLTALPQFFGAWIQLLSVWLGSYFRRRHFVVFAAGLQALVVALMSLLAALSTSRAVTILIILAIFYHAMMNLVQPLWRAWMGSIVPPRRRGVFFASRTRLTMVTSLVIFIGGGAMLSLSEAWGVSWVGFSILFATAACGRALSSSLLFRMHDPDPHQTLTESGAFRRTFVQIRESLSDKTFRDYSLFVAGMHGVVAVSAPFFAVYQLRDLQFSYLEYSINSVASIATQFVCLRFWGRFSDRFGNRLVMLITSCLIPLLPLLWTVSPKLYYLLLVQVISGFAWSGFTLSTANYLYDIRPFKTHFATYAAVQSGLAATLVCLGALAGGYLAAATPSLLAALPFELELQNPLFVVFFASGALRLLVALWFIPRAKEPRVRQRPKLLEVVFRVARFNAISGVVLDWLTVTRKKTGEREKEKEKEKE